MAVTDVAVPVPEQSDVVYVVIVPELSEPVIFIEYPVVSKMQVLRG
jgi:hypothetical protein